MKTVTALAALATILATAKAQFFSVVAAHSGSPIHLLPVNAAGFRLYLGGTSAHYCPSSIQAEGYCPDTMYTNFGDGEGELFMGTIVPGGQQVYIDPVCGAVSYTQAHSAAIPEGAVTDGWSLTQGVTFGTLSWEGGLLACNSTAGGPWGIYGVLNGVTPPGDCLGFDALTANETKPAAWQYI